MVALPPCSIIPISLISIFLRLSSNFLIATLPRPRSLTPVYSLHLQPLLPHPNQLDKLQISLHENRSHHCPNNHFHSLIPSRIQLLNNAYPRCPWRRSPYSPSACSHFHCSFRPSARTIVSTISSIFYSFCFVNCYASPSTISFLAYAIFLWHVEIPSTWFCIRIHIRIFPYPTPTPVSVSESASRQLLSHTHLSFVKIELTLEIEGTWAIYVRGMEQFEMNWLICDQHYYQTPSRGMSIYEYVNEMKNNLY